MALLDLNERLLWKLHLFMEAEFDSERLNTCLRLGFKSVAELGLELRSVWLPFHRTVAKIIELFVAAFSLVSEFGDEKGRKNESSGGLLNYYFGGPPVQHSSHLSSVGVGEFAVKY